MQGDRVGPRTPPFGLLLALATAITLVASFFASSVRVQAELARLLPDDEPAARAYRLLLEKFGALERIYIVVEGRAEGEIDPERLSDAVHQLADSLGRSELVISTRAGPTDADEMFFLDEILPRAALLIASDRVDELRQRLAPTAIRERLTRMKSQLATPAGPFETRLLAMDPLGLADLLRGLNFSGGGLQIDPVNEIFVSPSGRAGLVVVTPDAPTLDSESGRRLEVLLDRTFEELRESFGDEFTFEATGGPLYAARNATAIRRDLIGTVIGAALSITLLLAAYFGGLAVPLVLSVTVLAAIVWTAAILGVVFGELSVIGISFASILIGLGVDYGIHGAADFRQAFSTEGGDPSRAMRRTFSRIGPAILGSALTTAAAAAVLTLAHFEPLRELGFLVAIGIGAVLAAFAGLGAPLVVLLARRLPSLSASRPALASRGVARGVDLLVALGEKHRGPVLVVAAIVTGLAIVGSRDVQFDGDLRVFRPEDSQAEAVERMLVTTFGLGLDGFDVIVEGTTPGAALSRAAEVSEILVLELPAGSHVSSPSDFLVADELAKQRIADLRGTLTPQTVAFLRAELTNQGFAVEALEPALQTLERFAAGETSGLPPQETWPDWLEQLVHIEADRSWATVHASHGKEVWPEGPPDSVLARLRAAVPSSSVASIPRVGAELRGLVSSELGRLTEWVVGALLFVLLVSFRGNLRSTLLSLVPVVTACLWLGGLCGAFAISIDLFSVAAAPLLLGIGVDNGLHALHGARIHGGIGRSLRHAGGAMALAMLTTVAGFASLAFSSVPALVRGGPLIALGAVLCLVATLVLLPALERVRPHGPARARDGGGPSHAPERGRLASILGRFHVTGVFWYHLHFLAVRRLPGWALGLIVPAVTPFFYLALRRIRRAIAANLAVVLGPAGWLETERRIFRTMLSFAWCLSERYENLARDTQLEITIENRAAWDEVTASRSGFLLLTGHLGNWEVGSALPSRLEGRAVHLVREQEMDPRAQKMIESLLRERMGPGHHTHFATGEPRLGIELLEALRDGGIVALQGDRPRSGGKVLRVELFGRPLDLPAGPAALARAADVPILPVALLRSGRRRYRVRFGSPLRVARLGDRQVELRRAALASAAFLESAIRDEPHQWFCFRSLWPSG